MICSVVLLDAGANPFAVDDKGASPLSETKRFLTTAQGNGQLVASKTFHKLSQMFEAAVYTNAMQWHRCAPAPHHRWPRHARAAEVTVLLVAVRTRRLGHSEPCHLNQDCWDLILRQIRRCEFGSPPAAAKAVSTASTQHPYKLLEVWCNGFVRRTAEVMECALRTGPRVPTHIAVSTGTH